MARAVEIFLGDIFKGELAKLILVLLLSGVFMFFFYAHLPENYKVEMSDLQSGNTSVLESNTDWEEFEDIKD